MPQQKLNLFQGNFGKPTDEFGTVKQANEDDAVVNGMTTGVRELDNGGSRRFSLARRAT
jgi:hypothetical protein